MKKLSSTFFLLTLFAVGLLFQPSEGLSAILFQDDFESDPSNWQCTDGEMSQWDAGWGNSPYTCSDGGYAHWRMGNGHNSNNAVECYQKSGYFPESSDFRCGSVKWIDSGNKEWYNRWYMKIPSAFDKSLSGCNSCKLWRYNLQPNGVSGGNAIYLNFYGGSIGASNLAILGNYGYGTWKYLYPVSNFHDGQWHSHEVHIKQDLRTLKI